MQGAQAEGAGGAADNLDWPENDWLAECGDLLLQQAAAAAAAELL